MIAKLGKIVQKMFRMEVRLLYVRHFPMYLTLKTTDENSMQIFGQFSVLLQAIMRERGKREI